MTRCDDGQLGGPVENQDESPCLQSFQFAVGYAAIRILGLSAWIAPAQTEKTYLLPSPVRLSGAVTDAAGQPLPDVWIDHTGLARPNSKTDSHGRFEIETRAAAIVFRKGGFQSKYLRIDNSHENSLAVILSGLAPQMKPCNGESRCRSAGRVTNKMA